MRDANFKSRISAHLKTLRQQSGLSLDAAAKLTGVSKAMLGQIEREESSPTIATLWKISSGLNTSFSAFLSSEERHQREEKAFPDDPNMQVKVLFPFQADVAFEMFEITLRNHHKQMSTPHATGVIEHVQVTQGSVNVFFDNQWHKLLAGEGVRFFSDQVHGYQALSDTAVFHNIVSYPPK